MKTETLAERAKAAGLRWDDVERNWTGELISDGAPMQFWLSSKALVPWLDSHPEPSPAAGSPIGESPGTEKEEQAA